MSRVITVGRDPSCDIVLPANDTRVSRVHARIQSLGAGRFNVEDLGSANGVSINGQRVRSGEFGRGDRISFGTLDLDMAQIWRFDVQAGASGSGRGGPWLRIGRDPGNEIVLPADVAQVSRTHARIRMLDSGDVEIADAQSGNGVFVNDLRVGEAIVHPGDRVRLGSYPVDLPRLLASHRSVGVAPVVPMGGGTRERSAWWVPGVGVALVLLAAGAVLYWRPTVASGAAVDVPTAAAAKESSPTPGAPMPMDPAAIFDQYGGSVVMVQTRSRRSQGLGSGFFVDASGMLVTNHHVIDGAIEISVQLIDGTEVPGVTILADDEIHDLAVLRMGGGTGVRPVVLGPATPPRVGEHVVAIGNPIGLDHSLTDGVVSAVRDLDGHKLIQMSVPISPGNSGGPVFDMSGRVVGVAVATLSGAKIGAELQSLNLAVPVADVRTLLASAGWVEGPAAPVGGTR